MVFGIEKDFSEANQLYSSFLALEVLLIEIQIAIMDFRVKKH